MQPVIKRLTLPSKNDQYQFHPTQLNGKERSSHVIQSLLDYNKGIIENNPLGATIKFTKLSTSPFIFMRGTADLMYQDLFGTDADKPLILCIGDVHLENYGVMETNDGSLLWGPNDFDEANFAPFTWDVKRGATSVILAALDNSFSKKKGQQFAYEFSEAYLDTIHLALDQKTPQNSLDEENSPKIIRKLIKEAAKVNVQKWLQHNYLDPNASTPRFKNTDEIERIEEGEEVLQPYIQKSLNHYLNSLREQGKKVPQTIKVWDIATKVGSGTGSIGLWRYYALVENMDEKKDNLLILEIKQERPSVLAPYVGGSLLNFQSEGSRVAYAENINLPDANPYYGYTEIEGISYLVRERSPYKKRVALDTLKKKSFLKYAEACGNALAIAHLQSDTILSQIYPNTAEAILDSIQPTTFSIDLSGFAANMASTVRQDWKYFKKAFRNGMFNFKEMETEGGDLAQNELLK